MEPRAPRPAPQPRGGATHRRPTHSGSEPQTSTHKVSRSTQTPSQRPERPADEPDSRRSRAPVCPQCLTGRRRGRSKQPVGAAALNPPPPPHHCLLCGRPAPFTSPGPDHHRSSNRRPAPNTPWTQNTPVYPPRLLYHPPPLCVSPRKSRSAHPEVRGHRKVKRRCSLSAERPESVDRSLDRAIRAAQSIKHTSRHMVRSLVSGLQDREVLHHPTWTATLTGPSSHNSTH